jgi:hypothetical protein
MRSGMCEKCIEIDEKVERYRSLASRLLDGATIKGIEALIADLRRKKNRPSQFGKSMPFPARPR